MLVDVGEADVATEQIDQPRKTVDPCILKELTKRRGVTGRTTTNRDAELEQRKATTVPSEALFLFEDRAAAIAFECQRDEEHQRKCYCE